MKKLLPLGLLIACVAGVHWYSLAGPGQLTAHHDNLDGAAPLRLEAARQWNSGNVPLWNPYKRGGMPLAADTTAGALYPGNAPFLWQHETASPFDTLDLVAVLHSLTAAVFVYVFLSALGVNPWARALGALVFSCSGTMGWFAAWYIQIQNSAIWLPLVLACVHTGSTATPARTGKALSWIALGAVAVALQWLAGFPEFSVYTGLVAVAYALTLRGRGWRPAATVFAIYAAGIALAAVQLVPALELQWLSRRPASLPLDVFQSLAASPSMPAAWLVPQASSGLEFPPPAAYHFGAAAVAAALAGLFVRHHAARFFAVLLAIGFVLSIGSATPVSEWVWHIPGLNAFRHPFKHLFELSFAMSVLAALGASRLLDARPAAQWPRAVVVTAIVATAISLGVNTGPLVSGNPANADTSGRRPALADEIDEASRLIALRPVFGRRDPALLIGDYATQFRVPSLHGAGPFLWRPLADATGMVEEEVTFRRGLFAKADRTLSLFACAYALQTKQAGGWWPPVDMSAYRVVHDMGDARLAKRDDAMAFARFVPDARCADATTISASLATGAPDPAAVALIDCDDGASSTPRIQHASPPPRRSERRAGRVAIELDAPTEGAAFLVIAQSDLPGWTATANEKPAKMRRVHGLVQGIEVPAGTTRIDLRYDPASFKIGAFLSAAAFLLLVIALAATRRSTPR